MIACDNDYPALRAAVRESVLGATASNVMAALRTAWAEAVVTRSIESRLVALRQVPTATLVRSMGIAVTTAALAAWVMSLRIPTYLNTSIPAWAFFFCAFVGALAAAWPDAFVRQWSRSGLRRISLWFHRH